MFKRITAAYSDSPESRRVLAAAIHLARILNADAVAPSLALTINADWTQAYERLQSDALQTAEREGVALQTHLLRGEELGAIVGFHAHHKTNLLVIGLHHRQSHRSRLWSTVYGLAQNAPCSVLGVH